MKLVYFEKVPLKQILHSTILFLNFFFRISKPARGYINNIVDREGGNNILQSKKCEDMEEAKSTKGEGGLE